MAILDESYDLFVQDGYNGSKDDFVKLINSNKDALDTAYAIYQENGGTLSADQYTQSLTQGEPPIKKKAPPSASQQPSGASNLADGSSVSPKPKSVFSQEAIVESITPQETPVPMAPAVTPSQKKAAAEEVKKREVVKPTKYIPDYEKTEEGKIISEEPVVKEPEKEDIGWVMNTVAALDRGFYKNLIGNPVKGLGTLIQQTPAQLAGTTVEKTFMSPTYGLGEALIKFGDYFNKTIDELAPQDEEFKNSLSDQFAQAFGQVASTILTASAGGAAKALAPSEIMAAQAVPRAGAVATAAKKLSTEIASPSSISAGLAMGQAEFDRAKELGATDDQAFESFYKNAAVGSVLEQIPVMQFFKRFNNATAGGVANYIKTKGVAGLTGGVEEMTTEVLQQLYANASAQEIYNINQDIFEGVGESGGIGFGVGFLLNAMGAKAKLLRKQGDEDGAKLIEDQLKGFENRSEKGGPSSYSVNGINIQSPEVIDKMIETMPASELSIANIKIVNDPELNDKLQNKIVVSSIKEQVKQANPNLDENSLDEITKLEQELRGLSGNTTQSGKDKAASIRSQIKTIQENAIQKQTTDEGVLRQGQPQVELQKVGEGNQVAEVAPQKAEEEVAKTPASFKLKSGQDVSLDLTTQSTGALKIVATDENGESVGVAKFDKDDQGNIFPIFLETNEGARRQGLMTGVYNYLKNEGYNIIEGKNSKSEAGRLFEESMLKSGEAPQKAEEKVVRNLDEGAEQNKGVEISSLKKQINAGLGKDMTLTPEEVSEISKTEFTVLPEEDIDKSDINKPIILIRKRGVPELSVTESLQDASEDPYTSLSDYFEIVDGRHRIKKAMQSGAGLNAIVITEQEYENATGIEMYSNKEVTGIVNDLGVRNLDEAISELQKKTESGSQRREYNKETGRDAESDLESLIEEKRFRGETKPVKDENIQTKRGEQPEVNVRPESGAAIKQGEPEQAVRNATKRTEVKESIQKAGKSGVLRSAINKDQPITDEEIDAQMELLDAMSNVWKETTGSDNFYETFVGDVKEGDINAILEKGGALFQDAENPSRPFSRVTLSVFELPEFKKMSGTTVSVNLINDLIKSRGKQIEKDIIASVLNQDKYNGKSKVLFDEFRDDVETQVMKLEKIRTSSYSSYGMDNLGNNQEYGSAETIIFNSPINHGKTGHFSGDFTGRGLDYTTVWEIKQIPGTDQYVAIDSNMPQGTRQDDISSYIGTAGPLEDVKKWIDNRNTPSSEGINKGMFGHIRRWFDKEDGIYNLAELQSDYFQKNKASYDLYAGRIPREEVDEYINKNFMIPLEKRTAELLKQEFEINLTIERNDKENSITFNALDKNGEKIYSKTYFTYLEAPSEGYTIEEMGEYQTIARAAKRMSETATLEKEKRFFDIEGEYITERKRIRSKEESDYIKKRIEEIRKSEEGSGALAQFIASQKFHEVRLFREALKDAAESGAKVLRFPTPYTLAVIEGYVSDTGSAPYEIISGDREFLSPGDQIDYAGDRMTVVESDDRNIIVAPAGQVYIVDGSQAIQDEVDRQVEDALYELKQEVDDIDAITKEEVREIEAKGGYDSRRIAGVMNDYFDNNPDAETLSWDDIEQKFSDRVYDTVSGYGIDELVPWAGEVYYNDGTIYSVESRRATETFSQPTEYSSDSNEDSFKDELSDEQETVVKKYEELGAMIKKMRPNAKVVEDGNNKKWIEVEITDSDKSNPIIAFQEEAGKVKGAIDFANDGKASIYMFDGADISTLAHEATGHLGRTVLEALSKVDESFAKDYEYAMKWSGAVDGQWSTRAEEKFARGFERYLIEGKAPSAKLKRVFEKLRTWLLSIYQNIKGSSIDIELTPEIVNVFDNLLSVKQKVSPEVKEGKPEGYDRLMNRVKDVIDRSRRRGQSDEQILDSVIKNVQSRSQEYINATDTQREQIVRDIREMMGKKEKAAPSVRKVMGTPREKVTVDEMAALKEQIRMEARAARDAKKDLNGKRRMIAELVNGMATQGKIAARQAESLIKKSNSINLDNPVMIDRFINYAGKVFADAEYASKLSSANSSRKAIKKLSKNKEKAANLTDLAKKFSEIEPSMVEDIDRYNAIAASLISGVRGSTSRAENVKLSGGIVVEDVMEYVAEAMNNQEKILLEQKKQELADLGIDATGLTYDQMVDLIMDQDEKVKKDIEGAVKSVAKKAFDIYSSVIRGMISSNTDPFTGESVDGMYTNDQKELVKKFMAMDLDLLNAKESLAAVDALLNFIQNGSTASMQATVSSYTGEFNINQLVKDKVVGKPLKLYWSPLAGRVFGEQFANLPILFERVFKGFNIGAKVKKMSGVSDVINGKAKAQKTSDVIVSTYASLFAGKKPNGQKFNTQSNIIERGMYAFMKRNVVGTQAEFDAEFARRKGIVEESIKRLSEGNSKEKDMAKVYQEVYDKILKDSESIQDISEKTDSINKDAVNWWISEWADKYDQLADVSENVYNKILEKDLMYTPDRYSKMKEGKEKVDIKELESSFHYNNNTPYMKETGTLMEATRPDAEALNKGAYINLSFDSMNANAMYDALVDIETAAPIRQVSAFMNSDAMKKLIPDASTRDVLIKRVNLAIRSIRKKMPYDDSQLSSFMKKIDTIAKLGTAQALGGVSQPLKQMGPVMMNTIFNSGRMNMKSLFNKAKMDFINRSGYAIANRGVESLANVSSINKILEKAAESSGEKALKLVEKAGEMWLKLFLVKPDVFVARASWMTYYEKSLREQGINPKNVDWNTHEVNEKAADYAQLMVDRQQNVSDADLSGAFFKAEKPLEKFIARTAFAFASFRLNQTMRMATDVTVFTSKTSSLEDKKIAALSLGGAAVELMTFKLIAGTIAFYLGSLTKQLMGDEEDDEDKEERKKRIINGQLTSSVQDFLSPIPPADIPVSIAASFISENLQDAIDVSSKNRIELYGDKPKDYWQSMGTIGITAQKIQDIVDISKLGIYGRYKNDFGEDVEITRAHQNVMPYMAGLMALSTIGLAPSEAGTVARNAERFAKKGEAKKNKQEKERKKEVREEEKKEKAERKAAKKQTFDMEDMEDMDYDDMYQDLMDQYKDDFTSPE